MFVYCKQRFFFELELPLNQIIAAIKLGDIRHLARAITWVENDMPPANELLKNLKFNPNTKVIGITGPPGAGKSTLVNALLKILDTKQKKIAVLAIDPSSPFNYGALLGDRVRMSDFFNNESVYIRSVASRGALGGLCQKVIEITDVLKSSHFDYIFIETVGVGQSEVEIAGIADISVVVLVPESGDEVQGLKAGILEIANIIVVNKADRPNAETFALNLMQLSQQALSANKKNVVIIKTIAHQHQGIDELINQIENQHKFNNNEFKNQFFIEKLFRLVQSHKMKHWDKQKIEKIIREHGNNKNIYELAEHINNLI